MKKMDLHESEFKYAFPVQNQNTEQFLLDSVIIMQITYEDRGIFKK